MKSHTWTIEQVFQDRRQFKVPFYQRAYVWTLSGQWERLWSDIADKADERMTGMTPAPHFLGAVVIEPRERKSMRGVDTAHIIDGQQRLTTLQYVLAGIRLATRDLGLVDADPFLDAVLDNPNKTTMANPEVEVFKLWPTFSDQKHFLSAITATSLAELKQRYPDHFTQAGHLKKIGIDHPRALEAVWSFAQWAKAWIQASGKDAAEVLIMAVLKDLKVVLIELEENDDAQVIFETLNGHGAALHATDLIRNNIFMGVNMRTEDPAQLYESKWKQFEADQWRRSERRGRLTKPRLEWLVYTALRAATGQEGDLGRLYVDFKNHTKDLTATQQLDLLDTYGGHYLALLSMEGDQPVAQFGRRLRAYDATTTHPLALKISTADIEPSEKTAMFNTIISYIVRRAVCGLTSKNNNNWFMSILRQLSKGAMTNAVLIELMGASTSDVSRWPDDAEFTNALVNGDIYLGRLDAARCRWLLTEIEAFLRQQKKSEEPQIPVLSSLDIDHIMPQSWFEHWPLPDGTKAVSSEVEGIRVLENIGATLDGRQSMIRKRTKTISTIGNLTLLNLSVNREAKHKAFPIKKELLIKHTALRLNVELIGQEEWNEDTIAERGALLADAAVRLYPR